MKKYGIFLMIFFSLAGGAHAADVVTAIIDKLALLTIEKDNKITSNAVKNIDLKIPGMITEHADKSCATLSRTVFYHSETTTGLGSMTDTLTIAFDAANLAISRNGTQITYMGPANYSLKDIITVASGSVPPLNTDRTGTGIFKFTIDTSKSPKSQGTMSFSIPGTNNSLFTFNLALEGMTYLKCALADPSTSPSPISNTKPYSSPAPTNAPTR